MLLRGSCGSRMGSDRYGIFFYIRIFVNPATSLG
jgi:hypothetical protein